MPLQGRLSEAGLSDAARTSLSHRPPNPAPVIPTGVARDFLACGVCTPGYAVEESLFDRCVAFDSRTASLSDAARASLSHRPPNPAPVIPTGVARLFLACGLCMPGYAVEESLSDRSVTLDSRRASLSDAARTSLPNRHSYTFHLTRPYFALTFGKVHTSQAFSPEQNPSYYVPSDRFI